MADVRHDHEVPPSHAVYRDAGRPVEERVDDLLGRITLEEKIGQLNVPLPLPAFMLAFLEEHETPIPDKPDNMHESLPRRDASVRGHLRENVGACGRFLLAFGDCALPRFRGTGAAPRRLLAHRGAIDFGLPQSRTRHSVRE